RDDRDARDSARTYQSGSVDYSQIRLRRSTESVRGVPRSRGDEGDSGFLKFQVPGSRFQVLGSRFNVHRTRTLEPGTLERGTTRKAEDAMRRLLLALSLVIGSVSMFGAEPNSNWTTFSGDNTGQRHSALTQVTPQNVSRLVPQWMFQTDVPGFP